MIWNQYWPLDHELWPGTWDEVIVRQHVPADRIFCPGTTQVLPGTSSGSEPESLPWVYGRGEPVRRFRSADSSRSARFPQRFCLPEDRAGQPWPLRQTGAALAGREQ